MRPNGKSDICCGIEKKKISQKRVYFEIKTALIKRILCCAFRAEEKAQSASQITHQD